MGDGTKLVQIMQNISKQPVKDTADFVMGTVKTIAPLSIQVDVKLLLTEEFLILSPLCKIKTVDLNHAHTYSGSTGSAGDPSHSHSYTGNAGINGPGTLGIVTLWGDLIIGDNVIMLKSNGGQKYYVLQRLEGI